MRFVILQSYISRHLPIPNVNHSRNLRIHIIFMSLFSLFVIWAYHFYGLLKSIVWSSACVSVRMNVTFSLPMRYLNKLVVGILIVQHAFWMIERQFIELPGYRVSVETRNWTILRSSYSYSIVSMILNVSIISIHFYEIIKQNYLTHEYSNRIDAHIYAKLRRPGTHTRARMGSKFLMNTIFFLLEIKVR